MYKCVKRTTDEMMRLKARDVSAVGLLKAGHLSGSRLPANRITSSNTEVYQELHDSQTRYSLFVILNTDPFASSVLMQ